MLCFIDERTHPFLNIPAPLWNRKGREMAQDSLQTFGVQITEVGQDGSFSVELSRTDPKTFLAWCAAFSIVRCDLDRSTDLVCFLGKSPLSLQVCEAFSMGSIPRQMISELAPDEIFTSMQNLADATLYASNERMDSLRAASDAGVHSATSELAQLERDALLALRTHGFKIGDKRDDVLGPADKPELSDAQRRELSKTWGDLSGEEDATTPEIFVDQNWSGF